MNSKKEYTKKEQKRFQIIQNRVMQALGEKIVLNSMKEHGLIRNFDLDRKDIFTTKFANDFYKTSVAILKDLEKVPSKGAIIFNKEKGNK